MSRMDKLVSSAAESLSTRTPHTHDPTVCQLAILEWRDRASAALRVFMHVHTKLDQANVALAAKDAEVNGLRLEIGRLEHQIESQAHHAELQAHHVARCIERSEGIISELRAELGRMARHDG